MKKDDDLCGQYSHYKTGKRYKVMGTARHSETHEEMLVYQALYECEQFGSGQLWVRPETMFLRDIVSLEITYAPS
jgi:hypothetical protein